MAKTMREEGLGRVVSVPSIPTQSPPPQELAARAATGGPQRASSLICAG